MNRNIKKMATILSLSVLVTMIGQPAFAKTSFTSLKKGMKNSRVLEVEKMLDALHYDYKLVVDKTYNSYTASNVKAFQKKYKLSQTGIVNKTTYDKLKSVYQARNQEKPTTPSKPTEPTESNNYVTLKLGASGESVKELQTMLAGLGYKVTASGYYDESTRFAVMLFQSRNKQTLTGEADAKTFTAIKTQYKNNPVQPKPDTKPTVPTTPTTPVTPSKPEQPQNPGAGTQVPLPAGLTAEEKEMVQLVNQERTSRGLAPYQVDMQLVNVARVKAQEMVNKGYFSHTSPTYGSPFQMMDTFGIRYIAAAENIAQNYSVSSAHQMFMNSSGHKANIMSPTYDYVAIAVVNGGPHGKTFVQMFLKK
ncbi:peptidoglycan-binding protein [Brevibacillus porteri]|uniref:Serine protease n=1 Tax=Brevibacillus porteri TaxID=2126350 RepID=A0ABX5FG41_9BACL|nr:peptidoglycan-binding protein [Brevibacillus porteri]MED1799069.1 peptidoglycan-binding protein [Brevibacillus porteri]MED2130023.1 peptidoglycan-binding protein [Brevibacillus porteri]MED2746619.1 peptidoglycan-binding protein [Brevibacillus porteri]MED2814542.1 peptidoglycan-binding protein [Brevibacillus porteri]MED2894551.1 peptidoglycan-binding protein [Brevibacillus porteri]